MDRLKLLLSTALSIGDLLKNNNNKYLFDVNIRFYFSASLDAPHIVSYLVIKVPNSTVSVFSFWVPHFDSCLKIFIYFPKKAFK